MRLTKMLAPALCLSAALLAGCSQAPATDPQAQGGQATVTDETAVPAMTDWQDPAFYERPARDIASDLALLGFEQTGEYYDEESAYFGATFEGAPEENPVEGADETVSLDIFLSEPAFQEGTTEYTLDALAADAAPNGFDVFFYFPEVDSSEYEGLARKVADAAGLGAFTDSYVGEAPFGEGFVGNFSTEGSFKGTDALCTLVVSHYEGPRQDSLADAPLAVSYGYYV